MLFALDNISNGNWEDIRTVVCILILVTTKKGSIVRLACIPVFTAILYLQLWGSSTSASTPFQVSSEGRSLGNYLHHLNLLVLIGVDLKTDATHSLWSRLKSAVFYYAFNLRGIGTVHQTKNIPELPRYFRGKSNPKYEFILRQVTIGFWEYLVADLGLSLLRRLSDERRSRYYGAGEEWISWTDGTAAQWRLRFLATLVFWPTLKVALDIGHRFGSALLTATGMTSMSEWPPMFGSITSAYKLRNFWGKFWHQFPRWSLTSYSNLITREWLRIPKQSLFGRYLNNAIVFALSGAVHLAANWKSNIFDGDGGCCLFYLSFVVGYIIEDFIQHIWNSGKGRMIGTLSPSAMKKSYSVLPYLEKAVAVAWVLGFLTIVTPWWIYPYLRQQPVLTVPYSFVDTFGMTNVLSSVGLGAVFLYQVFEARP